MRQALSLVAVCALVCCITSTRAAEKTFKPDGEGCIRNWLKLDPITLNDNAGIHDEEHQKEFFTKEYFAGQNTAMPKEGDKVKVGDKEMAWKVANTDEAVVTFSDQENALTNAVTYIISDKDIPDAKLKIGSDDGSQWVLNGKEVVRVFAGRAMEKDQDVSPALALKKGVNVLRVRVINGAGACGMVARFVDKDDKPITALTITLTPPEK